MPAPTITAADITRAKQALLPTGPVWPREPDSVQAQVIAATAPTYERQIARSNNLLIDAFPATAVELLPEWESALGLPDPCAGESPTIQLRQQQVVARLIAGGGQSAEFFIGYAAALGYDITITMFAPFRAGMACGKPIYGEAWAHTWQVNAPTFQIEYFRVGDDAAGEPLAEWDSTVLQCELNRLKPAHTILIWNYVGQTISAPLDGFILDQNALA
jgi:uncharacterized protein YmfQ (DUF2313 family)